MARTVPYRATEGKRATVGRMALSTSRSLADLRPEYDSLYASMVVRPERLASADAVARRLKANEARYRSVADPLGIPWYWVAITHSLEGGGFSAHLHNGDPLTARTTHVPAGRPVTGTPPFTWEESARDALTMRALDRWGDWSLAGMLYQWERYNGFGYRARGLATPYLWSGSNHYTRGKFTSDGQYSPDAVSAQAGAATVLRRMTDLGLIGTSSGTGMGVVVAILAIAAGATGYVLLSD